MQVILDQPVPEFFAGQEVGIARINEPKRQAVGQSMLQQAFVVDDVSNDHRLVVGHWVSGNDPDWLIGQLLPQSFDKVFCATGRIGIYQMLTINVQPVIVLVQPGYQRSILEFVLGYYDIFVGFKVLPEVCINSVEINVY